MCCTCLAGNAGSKNRQNSLSALSTIAQLCQAMSSQLKHVSAIGKKIVKQRYLIQVFHNMANFGSLTAEIAWRVWATAANFNGYRVLALLLQRRRSPEANQTLHDVWPSPGLVHSVYISRGLLPPDGILPGAKFTLRPSLALSYIVSITAWHSTSGRQRNFAAYGTRNGITELSSFAEGATYIRLGGHHVWHRPTF